MRLCWFAVLLFSACVHSDVIDCQSGDVTWTCPAQALCNPTKIGCVTQGQLDSCSGQVDGALCMIGEVQGVCLGTVCEVSRCGDGFIVAPEQCEPGGGVANPHACVQDRDFYDDVAPGCHADCTYDYGACTGYCGDNVINSEELCDGSDPAISCADLGYSAGFLRCSQCGPGVKDCKFLNWVSNLVPAEDIHGTDRDNVFAVSGSLVSHFNGTTWSKVDISSCVPANRIVRFMRVETTGANKAILVGGEGPAGGGEPIYNDSVVYTVDGTTCTRTVVTTGTYELRAVRSFSPTNIWAVGTGIFHFDGTSWSTMNPLEQPYYNLVSLWGTAADNLYAGGSGGLWHYDGSNWTQLGTQSVVAIGGVAANDFWVSTGGTLEHWNGSSWSGPSSIPASWEWNTGLTSDGTHVYAGTWHGSFVLDGSTWSGLAQPTFENATIYGIWAAPAPDGEVFASNGFRVARYPGGVLTTQRYAPSGYQGISVAMSNAQNIAVLNTTQLYTYDGTTWASVPVKDSAFCHGYNIYTDMWRSPTGVLWFSRDCGGSGSTLMYWNGSGWGEPVFTDHSKAIWGASDTDMWILSSSYTDTVFQHFNGSSLDVTYTPGGNFSSIWGSSSSDIYAVGTGGIAHSTGGTWTVVNTGITTSVFGYAGVWGTAANDVYVIGKDIFVHYDGATWKSLTAAPGQPLSNARGRQVMPFWGTAGNDLFVASDQGLFHFDGIRWSPVRTTLPTDIQAITGLGSTAFMVDNDGSLVRLVRTVSWSNSM